ncbi:MAG: lipid asymmetry maintenance ABC transporter permease subunit MlaE [Pseudomonadota bacterium]|nr:lipid asymmetry maintenance ABC transporter permease subunit MlaE [Pseudomonadota bacterium]
MVRRLGHAGITIVGYTGRSGIFLATLVANTGIVLRRPRLLAQQIYTVGVMTLPIIVVAGLFVGMMLGLQGYNTLVDFGAESSLGLAVGLFLTRELGPVLTALLFAGRAGSALTAEIGLMRATQQLDAMEMMAVDPLPRVVVPRFLAGVVAMPLLAALFSVIGLVGGYVVGVALLGVDGGTFWSSMHAGVDVVQDVLVGVFKSLVFGLVVTWVAVFEGYSAEPTTEGVSRATTRAVVTASLAVLGLDYVMTAIMFSEV